MTTCLYLDQRSTAEGALPQVKIAINHRGSSTYISTGIRIPSDAWDAKGRAVKKTYANAKSLNIALSTKKLDVDNAIETLRKRGDLKGLPLPKVRRAVLDYLSPDKDGDASALFMARLERYRDTKKKYGTWITYESTVRKIREFDARADRLTFEDIPFCWLLLFRVFICPTENIADSLGQVPFIHIHFAIIERNANPPLDSIFLCFRYRHIVWISIIAFVWFDDKIYIWNLLLFSIFAKKSMSSTNCYPLTFS